MKKLCLIVTTTMFMMFCDAPRKITAAQYQCEPVVPNSSKCVCEQGWYKSYSIDCSEVQALIVKKWHYTE